MVGVGIRARISVTFSGEATGPARLIVVDQKSLPSTTQTALGCSSRGARYSWRRAITASSSQGALVRKRCMARAGTPTESERFSVLRWPWDCTSRARR